MILSDFDLWNYIRSGRLVVKPFTEDIVRENGLDLRLSRHVARLKGSSKPLDITQGYDPDEYYVIEETDEIIVKPYERVLLCTLEYIKLPLDLMAFVNLRSTFARLGLMIPPTIVDANFEGQLTIELVGGPFPVKLRPGVRFLHLVFAKLTSPVERPYSGKYQGQVGVTLPKVVSRNTSST